jgi:hypothetical protein
MRPDPISERYKKKKSYEKTRLEKLLRVYIYRIQSYRRIALLALALRCANTQQIETLLSAAGFRTVIIAAGIPL